MPERLLRRPSVCSHSFAYDVDDDDDDDEKKCEKMPPPPTSTRQGLSEELALG